MCQCRWLFPCALPSDSRYVRSGANTASTASATLRTTSISLPYAASSRSRTTCSMCAFGATSTLPGRVGYLSR